MDDNTRAMTGFNVGFKSNAPAGVVGRLFQSLFFLLFLGMGLLFVWLVARDSIPGLRTWTWKKTGCEITASSVAETDQQERRTGNFYFQVEYRYQFGAQTFTSDRHRLKPASFSDYGKAARLTERYRAGSSAVCYVNPSVPQEAVLERASLLAPFVALFPMIFVAIGAGGIYFTWRRGPGAQGTVQPISERAGAAKGQRFAFVFFLIFLLIGSGLCYSFFFRPLFKILSAKDWPAVPCVVISSEVRSHSGDDGDTYSVNILYSYEINGREFKANRYDFMGGSSSGYDGKQAIVRRHPPGTKTLCYVNPADPTEAVLERGFTSQMWFGLIPLVFAAFGAGGLIFVRRKSRAAVVPGATGKGNSVSGLATRSATAWTARGTAEPLRLKPKMSPWTKLLVIIGVALFWNGIVSVFVAQAVNSWRSGHPEWLLTIFMVPFVLIGLGFIGGILYSFLALFNPRPHLTVTPGAVPLGATLNVQWEITGRVDMLQNLHVRLEGREEATYRQGTRSCTDKSVFADLEVARLTSPQEFRSGNRTVTVPAHLMHSFAGNNNKILWTIQLHGPIPRWPDLKEEFPLTVLPRAPG
jgi:hypothetical protein